MDIREIIERARRAQIEFGRAFTRQLEIPNLEPVETLWASEQEQRQHFYDETYTPAELQMAKDWDMGISGRDF